VAPSFYRLRVPDEVATFLRGLHPRIKAKIKEGLRVISEDPNAGKALREELSGLRSFRVGRFRIVYRQGRGRVLEVIAVGPRQRIYEETFRLVRREIQKKKP